jgi:AraC-like DNA-binding protein
MIYKEYKPAKHLEQYVKCYCILENAPGSIVVDHAFATGCLEVMFTLDGNVWETKPNNQFIKTSPIEVWGQVLKPLMFRISGYSKVFGIRFLPSAPSFFFKEDISELNDRVFDLPGIQGNSINEIHSKLQYAKSVEQQIELMDNYLLKKLSERSKSINKINLVQQVMDELTRKDFFDNIENVAERYGITSRYLQKIFVQQTGMSPKLYSKINRFQNSLVLMGKQDSSLTDVAYSCGYFDQSHFIREFKSFTGFSPSGFKPASLTVLLASPNK